MSDETPRKRRKVDKAYKPGIRSMIHDSYSPRVCLDKLKQFVPQISDAIAKEIQDTGTVKDEAEADRQIELAVSVLRSLKNESLRALGNYA